MPKNNNDTIAIRQSIDKTKLIEQFKTIPIIQVACQKTGVSRATYYRWLEEDPSFREMATAAIAEGEAFLSDKSEAQIITLVGEKNFGAAKYYLEHNSEKYAKGKGLGGRPDRKIRVIILHDNAD